MAVQVANTDPLGIHGHWESPVGSVYMTQHADVAPDATLLRRLLDYSSSLCVGST
jgi:hypothetical protein